jgi:GNAT superfamily N-acetyltransferase
MEIKVFHTLTQDNTPEILVDAFRFSYLMIDAGERKEAIFSTVTNMLQTGNGCFFSISDSGHKVGYGVFSYGRDDKKLRRLYYFALEREYRGNGNGLKLLKLAMESEVSMDHGCTLACQPKLQKFYEKAGFEYYSKAEDNKNEIIMVYYNSAINNISHYVEQVICKVQIQPEAYEIFKTLKKEMKRHKIKPPKQIKGT